MFHAKASFIFPAITLYACARKVNKLRYLRDDHFHGYYALYIIKEQNACRKRQKFPLGFVVATDYSTVKIIFITLSAQKVPATPNDVLFRIFN